MHNPGAVPSDDRLFSGADLLVVFEEGYASYSGSRSQDLSNLPSQNINNYQRQNFAYMVNSVPSNWSSAQLKGFIDQIQGGAQYFFITDLSPSGGQNVYGEFGTNWGEFVDVMGTWLNST